MSLPVPALRIAACNEAPVRQGGDFVLYWMIAARRTTYNYALDRALEWGRELGKPVVVLEALRLGYRWASDRLHRFVIEGMADNEQSLRETSVLYYPYVEQTRDQGKGLLAALSARAAVVVTDEFPCFFLPHMVDKASRSIAVRMEQVDSNGLLPLRATDRVFPTAYAFRRFLQRELPAHLANFPRARPLARWDLPRANLPPKFATRWPRADLAALLAPQGLAHIPIDHRVAPAPLPGGQIAAKARLNQFVRARLERYDEDRNEPDRKATSGLSPYLHFGHVSTHDVFAALRDHEGWTESRLAKKVTGQREGYWGMGKSAEAFVDQFVTWRELGYNMCHKRTDYAEYDSLPEWAKTTLREHENDHRPSTYTEDELERGDTHDELWNAAQAELVRDGNMHNYLRMLWGKKILEWSPHPRQALSTMIELMNRYSLDGRNPNSYSGYFWVLGRYDRPWGPVRPIFGKIRYMSSDNTRRKLDVRSYLLAYAPAPRSK